MVEAPKTNNITPSPAPKKKSRSPFADKLMRITVLLASLFYLLIAIHSTYLARLLDQGVQTYTKGASVISIDSESLASESGIRPGDRIHNIEPASGEFTPMHQYLTIEIDPTDPILSGVLTFDKSSQEITETLRQYANMPVGIIYHRPYTDTFYSTSLRLADQDSQQTNNSGLHLAPYGLEFVPVRDTQHLRIMIANALKQQIPLRIVFFLFSLLLFATYLFLRHQSPIGWYLTVMVVIVIFSGHLMLAFQPNGLVLLNNPDQLLLHLGVITPPKYLPTRLTTIITIPLTLIILTILYQIRTRYRVLWQLTLLDKLLNKLKQVFRIQTENKPQDWYWFVTLVAGCMIYVAIINVLAFNNLQTYKQQIDRQQNAVYVLSVIPGSLADVSGIKDGDYITSINNVPVQDPSELQAQLLQGPDQKLYVSLTKELTPADTRYVSLQLEQVKNPTPAQIGLELTTRSILNSQLDSSVGISIAESSTLRWMAISLIIMLLYALSILRTRLGFILVLLANLAVASLAGGTLLMLFSNPSMIQLRPKDPLPFEYIYTTEFHPFILVITIFIFFVFTSSVWFMSRHRKYFSRSLLKLGQHEDHPQSSQRNK